MKSLKVQREEKGRHLQKYRRDFKLKGEKEIQVKVFE